MPLNLSELPFSVPYATWGAAGIGALISVRVMSRLVFGKKSGGSSGFAGPAASAQAADASSAQEETSAAEAEREQAEREQEQLALEQAVREQTEQEIIRIRGMQFLQEQKHHRPLHFRLFIRQAFLPEVLHRVQEKQPGQLQLPEETGPQASRICFQHSLRVRNSEAVSRQQTG